MKPLPASVPAAIYAAEQAGLVIAALGERHGRIPLTRDLLLRLIEAAHVEGQRRAFAVWAAHGTGKTEAEIRAQFDSEGA